MQHEIEKMIARAKPDQEIVLRISPEALGGLAQIFAERRMPTLRPVEPAWRLLQLVRWAIDKPDTPEIFPKGKWATLQAVEASARREIAGLKWRELL